MVDKAEKAKFKKLFKTKVGKQYEKAKSVKAESYDFVAPTGDYSSRLSSVPYGVDKNNNPYFHFNFVLLGVDPDKVPNRKCQISNFINDDPEDWDNPRSAGEKTEDLSKNFQRLGKDPETDGDSDDIADALGDEKPYAKLRVKKTSKGRIYVQILRLLTEDEIEEIKDEQYEEEEDEDTDEDEVDDDDDSEDEEDEPEEKPTKKKTTASKKPPVEDDDEDEEPPEDYDDEDEPEEKPKRGRKPAASSGVSLKKGAKVMYKLAGGKAEDWVITLVHDDDTFDLKRVRDNRIAKGVAEDDLK